MKKREEDVEGKLFVAERQYNRMMENIKNGILDREEVVRAMDGINRAHRIALKHNKGHLIK